jgi:hypothetical protein
VRPEAAAPVKVHVEVPSPTATQEHIKT